MIVVGGTTITGDVRIVQVVRPGIGSQSSPTRCLDELRDADREPGRAPALLGAPRLVSGTFPSGYERGHGSLRKCSVVNRAKRFSHPDVVGGYAGGQRLRFRGGCRSGNAELGSDRSQRDNHGCCEYPSEPLHRTPP